MNIAACRKIGRKIIASCIDVTSIKASSMSQIQKVRVLFKSEHFLVVDKPFDVKINSLDPNVFTLATSLAKDLPELYDPSVEFGFRFVHRLDYATSGAICIALTKDGAAVGHRLFEKRCVKKLYLALVRGHVQDSLRNGIKIDKAIGHDGRKSTADAPARYCTADSEYCLLPRPASTSLHVLERGLYDGRPASKVLLVPHTGRSHQLRVHCASIGHLIVGDFTYSDRADTEPYRMMLHSYQLALADIRPRPTDGMMFDVTASDPLLPELDPNWQPEDVVQSIDDVVLSASTSAKNLDS